MGPFEISETEIVSERVLGETEGSLSIPFTEEEAGDWAREGSRFPEATCVVSPWQS